MGTRNMTDMRVDDSLEDRVDRCASSCMCLPKRARCSRSLLAALELDTGLGSALFVHS